MADDNDGDPGFAAPRRAVKAYMNPQFLNSADARLVRILSEYLEPLQRFQRMDVRETIVFFGSARARPPVTVRTEYEAALEEKKKHAGRLPKDLRKRLARLEGDIKLSIFYEEAAELSAMLTQWAKTLDKGRRFVICSGGGPGIMEAANRGAAERARGMTVGLSISLPTEERPNPFITPELLFEFHYFFMRKLWFAYLACALVIFPGGFGTMDELFEILTLVQTRKIERPLPIILYGKKFWREFLNFDALVRWGTISPRDVGLFRVCDTPREAFEFLKKELIRCYPRPLQWGLHARE
jgi:hypothetical protein